MPIAKVYLGDAVYACWERGDLVLTTEDGLRATNTIVLELEVVAALLGYLDRSELPPGVARKRRARLESA
jgi:hypothetical protein